MTGIITISAPSSPYDRPSPVIPTIEEVSLPLCDDTILISPVNELKRKLYVDGYDEDTIKRVMSRRRTLKSRMYTRKCRAKCRSGVLDMRRERDLLEGLKDRYMLEISMYKQMIHECSY